MARISLSSLADDDPPAEIPSPRIAARSKTSPLPLDQVAANPLNVRDIDPESEAIQHLRDSILENGQLQPSAVVTRRAFLKIFPKYEETIGSASYVQITGGRRRVALALLGRGIEITIKDEVAETRSRFLAATASENLDREDYDAIEEARAIDLIVQESASQAAAARQLGKSPGWITQRLNLLKLGPEAQNLIRAYRVPLRDVRTLHTMPHVEQTAALEEYLAARDAFTAVNDGQKTKALEQSSDPGLEQVDSQCVPQQPEREKSARNRLSPVAAAIRKLGENPAQMAASLRTQMPAEDLRALAEEILKDLS
jgi:ParB family transcriptional regulator, chromosome partitioning protein